MGLSTARMFKHRIKDSAKFVEFDEKTLLSHQRTLLSMADDVISFCQRHGIRYLLGGGTALGAARHQGFIPWDNDIDMNMPRADYLRFISLFPTEMSAAYWLHTPAHTQGYGQVFARVRKKGTVFRGKDDVLWDGECGIYIDISVVENTYDTRALRALHGVGCLALGLLRSCRWFFQARRALRPILPDTKEARRAFGIKCAIGFLVAFASLDAWTRATDRFHALCANNESLWVTIPSGSGHFFGELYRRETLLPAGEALFEGRPWCMPRDAHAYLTRLYGDYMQIPPPEERETHGALAYENPEAGCAQ